MFCIEWICRTTSGTSMIRTRIVSATIDQAHGSPTLLWKKSRIVRRRVSSGLIGLAIASRARCTIMRSPLRRDSTDCSAEAASLPSRSRSRGRAFAARRSRTASNSGGTCIALLAGTRRPCSARRRRGRCRGASCGGLLEDLGHALGEPFGAVLLHTLDQARSSCQDVVPPGMNLGEHPAPRLAKLALEPVPDDGRAVCLGDRKAKTRLTRAVVSRKPVQHEEARGDRAAMPVDGVEIARAAEPVPALHRATPKGASGLWPGGA